MEICSLIDSIMLLACYQKVHMVDYSCRFPYNLQYFSMAIHACVLLALVCLFLSLSVEIRNSSFKHEYVITLVGRFWNLFGRVLDAFCGDMFGSCFCFVTFREAVNEEGLFTKITQTMILIEL